jgi:hypothetical protein
VFVAVNLLKVVMWDYFAMQIVQVSHYASSHVVKAVGHQKHSLISTLEFATMYLRYISVTVPAVTARLRFPSANLF